MPTSESTSQHTKTSPKFHSRLVNKLAKSYSSMASLSRITVKSLTTRTFFDTYIISPYVFLILLISFTIVLTYGCSLFLVWEKGNLLFPSLWLTGFSFLIFDFTCNIHCAFFYPLTKPLICNEVILHEPPPCAIIYPIRNEPVGLYERLAYTLENNNGQNVTLWFLSDSATDYFEYENTVVNKLRTRFGKEKIRYRHRPYPEDAKPGNIKEWLIHHHQEYTFFFVCDADSMIPKGALLKLLQKGEHPDNAHVAIFQTRIEIAHAKTLFSKYQALSARTSQKLYTDVKQRFFRTALSFGHGNLIRTNAFLRIQVPKGVLSHDIWDMALLNQLGYKTVYCPDVVSFEEAPNNYLEMRIRDRRWIKGNFQSAPLLLKKGLSLGTRFYLSYGLFMYLCQPIVLCWIVLNLMGNSSLWGQFLYFKPIINTGMHPLYIEMSTCTIIILSLVFLHKFVLCKTLRDCSLIMKETIFSTLLSLNNIIYHTIDILIISFQTIRWVPMKKNPYATLTFIKATRQMWPGTLFGIAVVYFIMNYCPHIALLIVPIVIIFSLSIPIMYITSLPLSR